VGLSALLHLKTVPLVVTIVCVADLVLLKVTELAAFGFAAMDQMKQTSIQSVVVSLLRLGGIITLIVTVHRVTLDLWVLTYLLTTLLGTLYALTKGGQLWGRPVVDWRALGEDAAEGVFFSVAGSATTVYNDIDKTFLVSFGMTYAAGIYTAAYPVIDVVSVPISSIYAAATPQTFREGSGGVEQARVWTRKLLRKTVPYGVVIACILFIAAGWFPYLFGPSFRGSVLALRWLCLLPLIRVFHYAWGTTITASASQWNRTATQIGAALLNVALNAFLIPRWSWQGAAAASLLSDGALAVSNRLVLWHLIRKERSHVQHAAHPQAVSEPA